MKEKPSCKCLKKIKAEKGTFQVMMLIGIMDKELLLQREINIFYLNHCRIYIAQVATDGKLLFWGAKVRLDYICKQPTYHFP